ncbi:MAG: CehA/McbA family metallohydrolase [Actinobacteria bacterium]|nr:CehA/McbA family metallohydrolase [Actinomycetota bacterium]
MCCEGGHDDLPGVVAGVLDTYRELAAGSRFDWGGEFGRDPSGPGPLWWQYARYADWWELLMTFVVEAAQGRPGTFHDALWRLTSHEPPHGLVVVEVGELVSVRQGPLPYALDGMPVELAVLVHAATEVAGPVAVGDATVSLDGQTTDVAFCTFAAAAPTLEAAVGGQRRSVPVVEAADAARLWLSAAAPCRWSVVDDRGGAWFPDGVLHKWDAHGRPYFHGRDIVLDVPAAAVTVTAARGIGYESVSAELHPAAGALVEVALDPEALFDPAVNGWFGGDLHVHLNYSGDYVVDLDDAARIQEGEALHVLNLVAANHQTTRVYDVEAFEHSVGHDLAWSTPAQIARFGVEYRNDMLGHVHAFAPSSAPSAYQSGHARGTNPYDWPPNAEACRELRESGATVGYTHPVFGTITAESPAGAFVAARSNEARELVADAALGLVDSVDLLGPTPVAGNVVLYHRLLSSGLRLAATAGTDTMLSMAKVGPLSNPPGWARVYAYLGDARLEASAWRDAVRAGRTLVTNGPWVDFTVDAAPPGTVLSKQPGDVLRLRARATGPGTRLVQVVGPDGPVAQAEAVAGEAVVDVDVVVGEPTWLAAVVDGDAHPDVLYGTAFAHTTPVYVDVDGRRVGRAADARWCIEWLDLLEALARREGTFETAAQLGDLVAVLDAARDHYHAVVAATTDELISMEDS